MKLKTITKLEGLLALERAKNAAYKNNDDPKLLGKEIFEWEHHYCKVAIDALADFLIADRGMHYELADCIATKKLQRFWSSL